jgi:hypothetical protein
MEHPKIRMAVSDRCSGNQDKHGESVQENFSRALILAMVSAISEVVVCPFCSV